MRHPILILLMIVIGASTTFTWNMQNPSLPDFVTLQDPTLNPLATIPKDLIPFSDLSRFGNSIVTYVDPSFVPLLKELLYAQKTMECIDRPYLKCTRDIKHLLSKKESLNNVKHVISWFELIYLMDMFNVPASIQDPLIVHIAKLINNHEQEAADITQTIVDLARTASMIETWRKVAALYKKLFSKKLSIPGLEAKGMSIQALLMLNLIDSARLMVHVTNTGNEYSIDLSDFHIDSLEGWEYLNTLIKNKIMRPSPLIFNTSLKAVNLTKNMISFIPNDFLSECINVQEINLSHNNISQLPTSFLSNCPKLLSLNLGYNTIVSLPRNFLDTCHSLATIDMSHNRIDDLPDNFLLNASDLSVLDFNSNNLVELPLNFLMETPLLKTVFLNNNNIDTLSPLFLSDAPTLLFLNLEHNQLSSLPKRIFSRCYRLQTLGLAYNNLVSLPHLMLSALRTITLNNNKLTMLSDGFFSDNPFLINMYIHNNQISELPANFLTKSVNLQYISLQNTDGSYPKGTLSPFVQKALDNEIARQTALKRKSDNEDEKEREKKKQKQ